MKTVPIIILLFALLCSLVFSQDRAPKASRLTGNPIYQQNCAKCHGDDAEGRHFRGPSLLSGKIAAASTDDLLAIITNGRHHMPKFGGKLAASDINSLVEQIKAANTK